MNAVVLLLAEGWWAVPAGVGAVGAGALGWVGVRAQRRGRVRRLELDAARSDVAQARTSLARSRAGVQTARAAIARAEADRIAGRASPADVAAARRGLKQAQREVSAANAALIARRADVRAARASVPARRAEPSALPLARLMATHDAINAQWISYETDPGKVLSYPSMSDSREPLTLAFLREQQRAQWLRPAASARTSPADYAAYRDAVRAMARAFEAAERDAWRRAGEARGDEPRADGWVGVAQEIWDGASRTIAGAAEAVARAQAAWPKKRPPRS